MKHIYTYCISKVFPVEKLRHQNNFKIKPTTIKKVKNSPPRHISHHLTFIRICCACRLIYSHKILSLAGLIIRQDFIMKLLNIYFLNNLLTGQMWFT